MPIYEYRCPNAHTFELFQRISDSPPADCQICGAAPLTKVLYPAAIHFKGSGFYATDYGRAVRKRDTPDGGQPAEAKADGKKDDGKRDKPETKAAEA
jgi:putative FmdB family regulatory protein